MTERVELPNQEKIRTHREKETYKYLGIVEADTIKQTEMREKYVKCITGERAKTTQDQTIQQEFHPSDKHLGCPSCKILGTILGREKNFNKLTREQEN